MVKMGVGVGAVMLVLAMAVGAALWGSPTSASSDREANGPGGQVSVPLQTSEGEEDAEGPSADDPPPDQPRTAFLGVAVSSDVSNDAGGAVVESVPDDGPSAGILAVGDVIVAIDGERVITARDVVDKVKAAQPGDVMTLSIRDKDDVQVKLGERTPPQFVPFGRFHGPSARPKPAMPQMPRAVIDLIGQLGAMRGNFVRGEVVLETDDGFMTIRGAAGTLGDIDVDNGTFSLSPKDGSAPIDYQISDDTVVITTGIGNLSGLNTEDRTLVVDVNGDVKVVLQGEMLAPVMKLRVPNALPGGDIFRFGPGGGRKLWPMPSPGGPRFHVDPNALNHMFDAVPFGPGGALRLQEFLGEDFVGLLDRLPQELRDRIEKQLSEAEEAVQAAPLLGGQSL